LRSRKSFASKAQHRPCHSDGARNERTGRALEAAAHVFRKKAPRETVMTFMAEPRIGSSLKWLHLILGLVRGSCEPQVSKPPWQRARHRRRQIVHGDIFPVRLGSIGQETGHIDHGASACRLGAAGAETVNGRNAFPAVVLDEQLLRSALSSERFLHWCLAAAARRSEYVRRKLPSGFSSDQNCTFQIKVFAEYFEVTKASRASPADVPQPGVPIGTIAPASFLD
jgi:hypothetical protein